MATLVLAPHYNGDAQRLWKAALAAGWSIEKVMGSTLSGKPVEPAIYGDALFAQKVASDLGVGLLEPPEDWLLLTEEWMRKRMIHYGTLEEAFNLAGPTFVKATRGKVFPARVYKNGKELRETAPHVAPNTSVLMSEPLDFEARYRTFVLNGKVVTASALHAGGEPEELNDAVLFAHEVAYKCGGWWYHPHVIGNRPASVERDGDIKVPPALVLDVGKMKGSLGWAVIDAKPAWGSALYACDEAKVLDVLRRATVPLPAVGDDERWVPRAWS